MDSNWDYIFFACFKENTNATWCGQDNWLLLLGPLQGHQYRVLALGRFEFGRPAWRLCRRHKQIVSVSPSILKMPSILSSTWAGGRQIDSRRRFFSVELVENCSGDLLPFSLIVKAFRPWRTQRRCPRWEDGSLPSSADRLHSVPLANNRRRLGLGFVLRGGAAMATARPSIKDVYIEVSS